MLEGKAVMDTFYDMRHNGSVDFEFGELSDLSKCEYLQNTFLECYSFKGKGMAGWDTSNVDDMPWMLFMCSSFEEDLSGWCVTKIKSEPDMFAEASGIPADHKPVWGTCPRGEDGG